MSVTEETALEAFSRAYLRRAHEPESTAVAEALQAEVASAFAFVSSRGRAPAAVRAFTPVLEEHGYATGGSVLETNTEDLPFLVDSVSAELRARRLGVRRVVHPIMGTQRDAAGRLVGVSHPRDADVRESVMHFELDRRLAPEELADLEDATRAVLRDVARVVHAFGALRQRLARMDELAREATPRYGDAEIDETIAFLRWLGREHFVLLGYREYEVAGGALGVVPGSGIGLLDDPSTSTYARPVPLDQLPPRVRERAFEGDLLLVAKTNRRSPVHRRERMDYIGVRRVAPDGSIVGEARLLGLFTSRAYLEPASDTPLLHRKLRHILEAEDLMPGSHDYKAAVQLFDSFPKDELFAAPADDLRRAIVALLGLHGDDVRLFGRRGADGRSASLIAALPRSRDSPELRDALRDLLVRRFGTSDLSEHEVLGEGDRVQLHVTVHSPAGDLPEVPFRELQSELVALSRTWDDAVRAQLVRRHGAERGRVLAARWFGRLPEPYRAATDGAVAAGDVACFERLVTGSDALAVGLQDDGRRTRVALYKRGAKVELSQATRLLEDLGLRVIEEVPARLDGDAELWIQAFGVLGPGDRALDLESCGARVADTLVAAWRGDVESDSLNRLVVLSDLDARQVEILRAYRRYRQRIGSRYTEGYQNDVIAANPRTTAKMMRLFELRFDPALEPDPEGEAALRDEILADIDEVALLDHDRILRNQLGLIEATVRTNAYRRDREAIAFKLRSADVPAIPQPPPLYEIYVYAPEMEGIHLRGGMIARGGIRWSERMDYRTEVFGLMRAQMTKNAIIVPTGAKGGFFVRSAPEDPAVLKATVRRRYETYIGALLDVTDNRLDGEVVHPEGVRVHDGEDSYLVVAADKGTATFSDLANDLAQRRGFWLGDAFASGGSTGYDHKALGITARGAWESVKRHFLELGLDPAADELTVVGIGDMSGDVFGNGMLLSDRIRLVAAYDHRHVFIDPDPDPAASFAERRRLFELPGSSWDDYDRALISEGGGVWPRAAKSVPLSPQARAALGVDAGALPTTEVIRAILRAPVDLLFNGGIGTVVKASTETHDEALDRSSDAIRVDACDLRCRVVAEGGNLGLTQRGRIEFAAGGGRINADFIDNSAGVDCSDHEVNLKVLLDLAVRRGELGGADRDALLEEVTGDVVRHVLYDSFLQAQILAQEVRVSAGRMFAYEDLMAVLEAEGLLHREIEALPTSDEMAERRRAGRGLERPELAVLVAYAKRSLTDAILESDLPEDAALQVELREYFPPEIVRRFGHLLPEHPLRRELVATLAANDLVNALGPTFVSALVAEKGAPPADVVRGYRAAREIVDAGSRWGAVERLDRQVDAETHWELMVGVDDLVAAVSRWYVVEHERVTPAALAAAREAVRRLEPVMLELRSEAWRDSHEAIAARLADGGVPADLARRHAFQPALAHAPDIAVVATELERSIDDVAQAFFLLGEGLRLEWLEDEIDGLPVFTRMQRWAVQAVRDDVLAARRELARCALREGAGDDVAAAVDGFLERRREARSRLTAFTRALSLEGTTDLAGLSLAVRHLRALAS